MQQFSDTHLLRHAADQRARLTLEVCCTITSTSASFNKQSLLRDIRMMQFREESAEPECQ